MKCKTKKAFYPFSFVWRKRGQFLDDRLPIRQALPLYDCDEHKRVQWYAMTHKENNGTHVQLQSER